MAKYIKKPIPIEAVEYRVGLEDGFDDIEVAVNNGLNTDAYKSPINGEKVPYILTLEGKHYISIGDYIITGVNGERYPCKQDIFYKTYVSLNQ
ncbi:hypothetical protein [Wukongibacter sp. M2B1]|uniref:hypothetical protein n=1 Tax=Wukongibacter sp. M2B1 TaxID=3088895 RepID=UPI003D7BE80B